MLSNAAQALRIQWPLRCSAARLAPMTRSLIAWRQIYTWRRPGTVKARSQYTSGGPLTATPCFQTLHRWNTPSFWSVQMMGHLVASYIQFACFPTAGHLPVDRSYHNFLAPVLHVGEKQMIELEAFSWQHNFDQNRDLPFINVMPSIDKLLKAMGILDIENCGHTRPENCQVGVVDSIHWLKVLPAAWSSITWPTSGLMGKCEWAACTKTMNSSVYQRDRQPQPLKKFPFRPFLLRLKIR